MVSMMAFKDLPEERWVSRPRHLYHAAVDLCHEWMWKLKRNCWELSLNCLQVSKMEWNTVAGWTGQGGSLLGTKRWDTGCSEGRTLWDFPVNTFSCQYMHSEPRNHSEVTWVISPTWWNFLQFSHYFSFWFPILLQNSSKQTNGQHCGNPCQIQDLSSTCNWRVWGKD